MLTTFVQLDQDPNPGRQQNQNLVAFDQPSRRPTLLTEIPTISVDDSKALQAPLDSITFKLFIYRCPLANVCPTVSDRMTEQVRRYDARGTWLSTEAAMSWSHKSRRWHTSTNFSRLFVFPVLSRS